MAPDALRKTVFVRETLRSELGRAGRTPITRVAGVAVLANPFAGRFVADLTPLWDMGREVGALLMAELLELLSGPAVSYGKAAVVGTAGEFEHGGGLLHPKLGKAMREPLGGGKALIPSNVKVGAAGAVIDVPLGHKDEAWSFDHFDTMTVMVADAPRPDEIAMIVALADGGRLHPRCGSAPIRD
jgi:hypothetical protein